MLGNEKRPDGVIAGCCKRQCPRKRKWPERGAD
jgi:hypothetical protein